MLKLGVCNIEQLRNRRTRTLLGRKKRVSVRLLNQLSHEQDAEELYDEIMYGLVDDRGAYKRTSASRFAEFDAICQSVLADEFSQCTSTVHIHDIGVSSARTSVDFFHSVSTVIPDLDYLATDYDHELTVIRDGKLAVALSSGDVPVEVCWPPFVFTLGRLESKLAYPLNHLVRNALGFTRVNRLIETFLAGDLDPSRIETVDLFCPAARELAARNEHFALDRYDLLEPVSGAGLFSCVRAMNVLNPNYFSDEQIQRALGNIFDSMTPGGVFIAGSNQEAESPVIGGVYRRSDIVFEEVRTTGENRFLFDNIERFAHR